jgi:hypothetical protein
MMAGSVHKENASNGISFFPFSGLQLQEARLFGIAPKYSV